MIEKDPSLESSRFPRSNERGAVCIHRAWGVGRISGFESDRGMILVDFEEGERKSHAMDPVFCLINLRFSTKIISSPVTVRIHPKKSGEERTRQPSC